jgi:hypothetical protein
MQWFAPGHDGEDFLPQNEVVFKPLPAQGQVREEAEQRGEESGQTLGHRGEGGGAEDPCRVSQRRGLHLQFAL